VKWQDTNGRNGREWWRVIWCWYWTGGILINVHSKTEQLPYCFMVRLCLVTSFQIVSQKFPQWDLVTFEGLPWALVGTDCYSLEFVLYTGHSAPLSALSNTGTGILWILQSRSVILRVFGQYCVTFPLYDNNNNIYYKLLHRNLVVLIAVSQQMRHKTQQFASCISLQLNKTKCNLPYDSLGC